MRNDAERAAILRRALMYTCRTLLLACMGAVLCFGAFLTAERMANLYILTSEGLTLRMACILTDAPRNDLEEYFTLTFLENDAALRDNAYEGYTITGSNYDLTIERINVTPWSMSATVMVVERVTLKGGIDAAMLAEGERAVDYPLPQRPAARYKVRFLNKEGRWFISEMVLVETDPRTKLLGTPDPNRSPIPMATPTPKLVNNAN